MGAATYSISDSAANITTALSTGNGGLTAVQNAVTVDATGGAVTLTLTDEEFNNFFIGISLLHASDTIEVIGGALVNGEGWTLNNFGGNETLVLSNNNN